METTEVKYAKELLTMATSARTMQGLVIPIGLTLMPLCHPSAMNQQS
jgi:uracil-DNA glycosylase